MHIVFMLLPLLYHISPPPPLERMPWHGACVGAGPRVPVDADAYRWPAAANVDDAVLCLAALRVWGCGPGR